VDAVGSDDDVGFDLGSVRESRSGAMLIDLDTDAARSKLDALRRYGCGQNVEQIRAMYGAATRAKASLQVNALWGPSKDATASTITDDLVFRFPCNGPNWLLEIERTQCLHRVRLQCYSGPGSPSTRGQLHRLSVRTRAS
jgi:hypothetical protein